MNYFAGPAGPPEPEKNKIKAYQSWRYRFLFYDLLFNAAAPIVLLASGLSLFFREAAAGIHSSPLLIVFFYFLFYSLALGLINGPVLFLRSFIIEKKFGFLTQTFGGWLKEQIKAQSLGFLFALLLTEILYALIRHFPQNWWVFSLLVWFGIELLIGKLAHVWILPLFYKSVPLEEETLKTKLLKLLARNRFSVQGVFVVNLSKTTKKANAAFAGFGKTRRVLIADTMLQHFDHEEIESVVAHELGHAKYRHVAANIFFNTVVSGAVLYVTFLVLDRWGYSQGLQGPADVAAFPLYALVGALAAFWVIPARNTFSRFTERQADDFAIRECESRGSFVSALQKLGKLVLSDFEPHPLVEFLFYSHPSLGKRIRRVREA